MKLLTIQHKNVLKDIIKNGEYKASFDNVSENLIKPYKFMSKQFSWDSCPIFMSPVGYYVEMGGAKTGEDYIIMEFEIPDKLCKVQKYYDWSDFIYFTELPHEFEDSFNTEKFKTVEDWGKTIIDIDINNVKNDFRNALQVTVQYLKKEWLKGIVYNTDKISEQHCDTGGENKLRGIKHYE